MSDTETPSVPLPIDWNAWRTQLHDWLSAHPGVRAVSRRRTPFDAVDRNLLADDIVGIFRLPTGRIVELSEVTFPDLSEPSWNARRLRYVGLTFDAPGTGDTALVDSWAALTAALGLDHEEVMPNE